MTKDEKLNLIYRHTHADYRGKLGIERAILIYRQGTTLVPLSALTDEEIAAKLPYAIHKQGER